MGEQGPGAIHTGLPGGEGETSRDGQLVVEVLHELVPRLNEGGEVAASQAEPSHQVDPPVRAIPKDGRSPSEFCTEIPAPK